MKKHLQGGSLRRVMVHEILRVMKKHAGSHSPIASAAVELGIAVKTLRQWKGPVDKGGWSELQPDLLAGLQAVLSGKIDEKRHHKVKGN
jgi:hypothetical protein